MLLNIDSFRSSTSHIGPISFLMIPILLLALPLAISGVFLSNLNSSCFRCICEASTGCTGQVTECRHTYCGPFSISRAYWMDAGQVVLPHDTPTRRGAFEDCANNYNCATGIINLYMEKYGTDCNNDGVVDCVDYTMLHINGGPLCHQPLRGSFANSFTKCMRHAIHKL
ncbi:lysozyme 2-like [Anopheles aquasalis]|uniref:lysozyme 2-like n=1 Tax=Anopheles aquasalis TaxID=42839 RepID=UPI00215A3825|nr:lysozyme 2-like [Anopheles aquasalis]